MTLLWLLLLAGSLHDGMCTLCEEEARSLRLPTNVKPVHYDICILAELYPAFVFQGCVEITVECKEVTSVITLHAKDLDITSVTLISEEDRAIKVNSFTSGDFDFLYIHTDEALEVQHAYKLALKYNGNISELYEDGFYKGSYIHCETGVESWWASTQFETKDARRAYPCFDEPCLKATFNISIIHHKDFVALSNMPEILQVTYELKADYVVSVFAKTELMSTYLVAFMISDYKSKTTTCSLDQHSVDVSIWTHDDRIDQVDHALDISEKVVSSLQEYFEIKFPWTKIDICGVDYNMLGMENWGMITMRERALLIFENSSFLDEWRIASLTSHEIAHFYFGNLVTCEWWSEIWLNEGFADYYASIILDILYPDFNDVTYILTWNIEHRDMDCGTSAPKILKDVDDESDFATITDRTPYEKGFLAAYFMHCFLGNEVFQTGMIKYLKKFSYSTANHHDLCACLTETAEGYGVLPCGVGVGDIMESWLAQEGIPLVTVSRGERGRITVSQERFYLDPSETPEHKDSKWWIPLTWISAQNHEVKTTTLEWLRGDQAETIIETGICPDEWIVLNIESAAYCRVNYDVESWKLLIEFLTCGDFTLIPERNRFALVFDSFQLARAGKLDHEIPINLLRYIKRDTAFGPWSAAGCSLALLENYLKHSDHYEVFQAYCRELLGNIYNELGFITKEQEGMERLRLQTRILTLAIKYNLEDCVTKSKETFQIWMEEGVEYQGLAAHFKTPISIAGVQYGGVKEWEFVYELFQHGPKSLRYSYTVSLCCTQDESLLWRLLEYTTNSSLLISSYAGTTFGECVQASRLSFSVCLSFLEKNARWIQDTHKNLKSYLVMILEGTLRIEDIERVKRIIDKYLDRTVYEDAEIVNAFKVANSNLDFLSKNEETILNFMGSKDCK